MGQTFYIALDDKKKIQGAKVFKDKNETLFKQLNSEGWGIFFSVNEFSEARKTEFCTRLRYVYGDLDIGKAGDNQTREEKEAKKLKLFDALLGKCEPTLIIATSNGLQPLWAISDNDPTQENKDAYTKINKGIVAWSKGHGCMADNVFDCARILRLSGYYHQKEEPYLCKFIHQSDKKYTLFELEMLFPFTEEKPIIQPVRPTDNSNPVFGAIEGLDFQELIIRAFASVGRPVSFDKGGRLIDPAGGTTGTFIGRLGNKDYLASSSHEPFRGNRITAVADILKIDYSDAYKWIYREFNLDFKQLTRQTVQKERIEKFAQITKKDKFLRYTWGTRNLDTSLAIIKPGNFIIAAAKSGSGKTTFVFDMACKNARLGHKVLFLSLEMDEQDIKDDFGRKYAGITIEEELDYLIPEQKQRAYARKIEEINTTPNLKIQGVRRNGEIQWEDIEDIIKKNGETDIVFVDNLDLIAAKEKENDLERQKRIVRNILNFTSLTKIPIVLIHHYRKTVAGIKDGGLDEMSGSGKIRDGADRIIKVARNTDLDAEYPEKYLTKIQLLKGRGYPECSREIYFIKGTFVDNPPTWEEYENPNFYVDIAESFGGQVLPNL